jgi:hypothetical protein
VGSSTLEWVGTAAAGGGLGGIWFLTARDVADRRRLSVGARRRSQRAISVATDASLDKEAFDPMAIRGAVDEILSMVTEVWAGGEVAPDDRCDGSSIDRWARSVAADLGAGVYLISSRVDVLGVVSRSGELEDRVVLRVRLRLGRPMVRRRSPGYPRSVNTDLRWTLGRLGRSWRLLTIDSAALTDEVLSAALIPGAWADEERIREEALAELADADITEGHISLRGLVSGNAPVAQQLSEISEVDRRFDRDLIVARLKRIVAVWEQSTAGSADLLSDVAAEPAVQMLLHGPPRPEPLRLILHDAIIESWTPVGLELSAVPHIRIALVVSAVRYVVSDRTGALAAGDSETRHRIALDWTLALYRDPGARWQLTSTSSPIAHMEQA